MKKSLKELVAERASVMNVNTSLQKRRAVLCGPHAGIVADYIAAVDAYGANSKQVKKIEADFNNNPCFS